MFAVLAASITLTSCPTGVSVSARMASVVYRAFSRRTASTSRAGSRNASRVTGSVFQIERALFRDPWTISALSVAPLLGCFDSGKSQSDRRCCLNTVVTIRKISTTIKTSMSDTMITVGACRRFASGELHNGVNVSMGGRLVGQFTRFFRRKI